MFKQISESRLPTCQPNITYFFLNSCEKFLWNTSCSWEISRHWKFSLHPYTKMVALRLTYTLSFRKQAKPQPNKKIKTKQKHRHFLKLESQVITYLYTSIENMVAASELLFGTLKYGIIFWNHRVDKAVSDQPLCSQRVPYSTLELCPDGFCISARKKPP